MLALKDLVTKIRFALSQPVKFPKFLNSSNLSSLGFCFDFTNGKVKSALFRNSHVPILSILCDH